MKTVIIGSVSENAGKTSFIVGLNTLNRLVTD
jgi:hypothetical protein